MAGKCEICGKTPGFGHNVSHSKRRTNRMFRVNVQRATVLVDGKTQKVSACARCLRTLYKAGRTA